MPINIYAIYAYLPYRNNCSIQYIHRRTVYRYAMGVCVWKTTMMPVKCLGASAKMPIPNGLAGFASCHHRPTIRLLLSFKCPVTLLSLLSFSPYSLYLVDIVNTFQFQTLFQCFTNDISSVITHTTHCWAKKEKQSCSFVFFDVDSIVMRTRFYSAEKHRQK